MRLAEIFRKHSLLAGVIGLAALTSASADAAQRRRPTLSPAEHNAGLQLQRIEDEPWQVVLTTFVIHCSADRTSQVAVPIRIGLDLEQARARNIGPQRRIAMLNEVKNHISSVFTTFAENAFVRDKMIYGEFNSEMGMFLIAYGLGFTGGRRLSVTAETPDVIVFGPGCGVPNWEHYAAMRNAHAEFLTQHTRNQENGTLDHSHRGIPDPIDIRLQTRIRAMQQPRPAAPAR